MDSVHCCVHVSAPKSMKLRIILADDHRIVREGLRAILANRPGWEIVAECGDGRSTVEETLRLNPHVVLLDLAMPELNGVEAARQIVRGAPTVRVIVLSMHTDRHYVAQMLKAGAHGYLPKDCAGEELVSAIDAVMAGNRYLSSSLPADYTDLVHTLSGDGPASAYDLLTAREREVLQCLAEGRSSKQIADLLGLKIKTVEAHRAHIVEKLGLRSTADLTKYAIREGLVSLD